MKLLHLDASIQAADSVSRILTAAIVDRFRAFQPDLKVQYRDLAAEPLPHITLPGFATDEAHAVMEDFLASDIVVLGAPMYNLAIPTQLKAWLDHIVVAGRTFNYGPDGVVGLAGKKRVIVAHTRGGIYSAGGPAAGVEHAESHLRAVLGFIGIADPDFITAEGLKLDPDARKNAIDAALVDIARLEPVSTARAA